MGARQEEYEPLATAVDAEDVEQHIPSHPPVKSAWQAWHVKVLVCIVLAQFVTIGALLSRSPPQAQRQDGAQFLYSPAQDVLEDELVVFRAGSEHKTPYQALTDEADEMWLDLYSPSIFMMPREEAVRLPNRTHPVTKDAPDGYYLGHLDVFHQLHCLNYLRMSISPERYKPLIRQDMLEYEHLSHCVDSIRQSLMCSSDISVNVWQWSEHYQGVAGRVNVAHSCRNFDKIKDWVRERLAPEDPINGKEYVENDLPFPPVYYTAAEYVTCASDREN
ncbi:hypothetical protein BD626DRAFT_490213 [Schizophyllum amplum]|uniref:Tat pathway signal sequence n=1 Tax=Schizophyllum amplum TaxID=97359 RepID=A0A550CJC8_9AGAR|nr:hypothetical protein BD626DRAFT_490213 [Auriculariopsis ampla]